MSSISSLIIRVKQGIRAMAFEGGEFLRQGEESPGIS
jgi:hypothetical protein